MGGVELVVLDFDGPVAALFGGGAARAAVQGLRELGGSFGCVLVGRGPLEVLQEAAAFGGERLTRRMADAVREVELRAVRSAAATPGFDAVLAAADAAGLRVAVASNNAVEAVEAYLRGRGGAAVFVGDSVSDVQAGLAARVPVVGYANKAGKRELLQGAGAAAVVDRMDELAEALVSGPGPG